VGLKLARNALAASIDPSLWGTGNHLQVHRGVLVFEFEDLSVIALQAVNLLPSRHVTTASINGWINTFVNVDRILATTQINDAIAANGTASYIQQAQSLITAGDQAAASGSPAVAIYKYKDAWKLAELSLGRHCDGGNDADDR
jgi:hypothetical protein